MKRLQDAGAAHAHDPCLPAGRSPTTSGSSARIRTRSGRAPHWAAHDPCSASGETAAAGRRKRRNRPPRPTGSLLAGPAHAHETGLESGQARSFERERGLHRRRGRRSARIRTCRPTWPMSQRRRSETAPRTWPAVSHLVTAAAPDAGELLQEPAPVQRRRAIWRAST